MKNQGSHNDIGCLIKIIDIFSIHFIGRFYVLRQRNKDRYKMNEFGGIWSIYIIKYVIRRINQHEFECKSMKMNENKCK